MLDLILSASGSELLLLALVLGVSAVAGFQALLMKIQDDHLNDELDAEELAAAMMDVIDLDEVRKGREVLPEGN